jgi:hypothetical protein
MINPRLLIRDSTKLTFYLALLTFCVLVYYKVCLCSKAKGSLKIFLLLNSLAVSDMSIISPRYQASGQMSTVSAFLLRISQKFINIVIAKTLLHRELPKLRDFTYFILLIIHFLAFTAYHKGLEIGLR